MTANSLLDLWTAAPPLVLLAGASAFLYALVGDAARGRLRCPRCAYDLRAARTLTCPECGHVAPHLSALRRTRRPRALLPMAALLLLLALPLLLWAYDRRQEMACFGLNVPRTDDAFVTVQCRSLLPPAWEPWFPPTATVLAQRIESLDASGIRDATALESILRHARFLHTLKVAGDDLRDDHLAPALARKRLRVLAIHSPQFTGRDLPNLNAPELETLDLRGCPVTDDQLSFLARCPNLSDLNLGYTKVRGSFLKYLHPAAEISQFDLAGCNLDPEAFTALAARPPAEYTRVDVSHTNVNVRQLKALRRDDYSVTANGVRLRGVDLRPILAVDPNTPLPYRRGAEIDDDFVAALIDARRRDVNLSGIALTPAMIRHLGRYDPPDHNPSDSDGANSDNHLYLAETGLTDADLPFLPRPSPKFKIHLNANPITLKAARAAGWSDSQIITWERTPAWFELATERKRANRPTTAPAATTGPAGSPAAE